MRIYPPQVSLHLTFKTNTKIECLTREVQASLLLRYANLNKVAPGKMVKS